MNHETPVIQGLGVNVGTDVDFGSVHTAKDLKDTKDEKDSTENFVNAEVRHYNAFVLLDIISNLQH